MNAKVSIEVDRHTADLLETRAAELGVTVPQLTGERQGHFFHCFSENHVHSAAAVAARSEPASL